MTIEKIFKKFGIVTLVEAEKLTGITANALKLRIFRGSLRGFKIGKTWLVLIKDVL